MKELEAQLALINIHLAGIHGILRLYVHAEHPELKEKLMEVAESLSKPIQELITELQM